jgi:ubiquinone/menaquinone biosynthesis C-methylase UbiE
LNTKTFADTWIARLFFRIMSGVMESRIRYRFFGPARILQRAGMHLGDTVLEVGAGTGYFTLPAARILGDRGRLIAMDVLPASIEILSRKVRAANVENVTVLRADALNTGLGAESVDTVLMFGVVPAPMLPLARLLPEMHRILRPGGIMALWPPTWVNGSIRRSGLFTDAGRRDGVSNFRRS